MIKLELKEIAAVHKAVSEFNIRGVEAPLITSILTKLVEEHDKLQKLEKELFLIMLSLQVFIMLIMKPQETYLIL